MKALDFIKNNFVLLDGSTGSLMQRAGLAPDESTESWSIKRPEVLRKIHKDYYDAGSNLVITNTFAANALKYDEETLEKLIAAAFENIRWARDNSSGSQEKYIAFDIGPLGVLLEPFGDMEYEKAVEAFSAAVRIAVKYEPDLILAETFGDIYETKAAVTAIRENSDLPVMVSNTYGKNGRLMTGADPETVINILEGMGVDIIGVNCSYGPDTLGETAMEYLKYASVPVSFKPNAGIPEIVNGVSRYDVSPEQFAETSLQVIKEGVRLAGGCCGTSPEYIKALAEAVRASDIDIKVPASCGEIKISSHSTTEVITAEDIEDYRSCAAEDMDDMEDSLCESEPICIKADDAELLEQMLRVYNGRLLADIDGIETKDLREALALVRKYGAVVIRPDAEADAERTEEFSRLAQELGLREKDMI